MTFRDLPGVRNEPFEDSLKGKPQIHNFIGAVPFLIFRYLAAAEEAAVPKTGPQNTNSPGKRAPGLIPGGFILIHTFHTQKGWLEVPRATRSPSGALSRVPPLKNRLQRKKKKKAGTGYLFFF